MLTIRGPVAAIPGPWAATWWPGRVPAGVLAVVSTHLPRAPDFGPQADLSEALARFHTVCGALNTIGPPGPQNRPPLLYFRFCVKIFANSKTILFHVKHPA